MPAAARSGVWLAVGIAAWLMLTHTTARAASPVAGSAGGEAYGISELLRAASRDEAMALDADRLAEARQDSTSLTWPVHRFLLAEVHRLRDETGAAYACYLEVIRYGCGQADTGRSMGRTLAGASLLRAVRILSERPEFDAAEAGRLLEASAPILLEEPTGRIFALPVLGGFGGLEETLLEETASLSWSSGDRSVAARLFLRYLEIASTAEIGDTGSEIADYLISQGIRSRGELALLRGKHFYGSMRYADARGCFNDALASAQPETRAGAGYYLARTRSAQGASRREILNLLDDALDDTADPALTQGILLYRADIFNREGRDRDTARFAEDLNAIIRSFPAGRMADDALYELASHYEKEGDIDAALHYLALLRDHTGPNDWLETAYFRAALILYSKEDPAAVAEAGALLEALASAKPGGQLAPAARFWLGRLASEQGDTMSARRNFESVIASCPYDYYAVRARMHLALGPGAARETVADSVTRAAIATSYTRQLGRPPDEDTSPAYAGWQGLLAGGLYADILAADRRLGTLLPARQTSRLSVEDLDRAGAFGAMTLLLALRQQVVGIAAAPGAVEERLALAGSVGGAAGDWPLAMLLVFGLDRSTATQSVLQCDHRYPAAAYPPVFREPILEAAGTHGVPPELLYAVMRRESLFHPAAVSRRGALGLFQFIPSTFRTLDHRWRVLDRSGAASMEEFIRDPELSIQLGARWFKEELLTRNRGDILLAVMEHNAGYPAVKTWREAWERSGRMGDVEYMIETARFAETRIFARSVLADIAVAGALGLFDADEAGDGR